jgi:hypothetical protein
MLRWTILVGLIELASCTQPFGPAMPPAGETRPAATSASCYVVKQDPTTVQATITFYGWPDNSPPGNRIAHPIIHKHAGGDGTYCNPTTFATERANDKTIPYGIKIYVPFIKQYFIREDLCAASGPKRGSGSHGCRKLWFDLWIGGTGQSNKHAVIECERKLTPNGKVEVILWPSGGLPVAHRGPIYRNAPPPDGSCDGTREQAAQSTRNTTLPN